MQSQFFIVLRKQITDDYLLIYLLKLRINICFLTLREIMYRKNNSYGIFRYKCGICCGKLNSSGLRPKSVSGEINSPTRLRDFS